MTLRHFLLGLTPVLGIVVSAMSFSMQGGAVHVAGSVGAVATAQSAEEVTQVGTKGPSVEPEPKPAPAAPAPTASGTGESPEQPSRSAAAGGGEGGGIETIFDANASRLSFQALLRDGGGVPLAGPTVNLEFRLYTQGGVLVEGPIAVNNVAVVNGVVDTQIPVNRTSFDGTARRLGVTVNPPAAEMAPRLQLTSVPYAFRVDRVASGELDDDIELGAANVDGELTVWSNANDLESIKLDGASHRISTFGSDGLEQIRLHGSGWGEVQLRDEVGNDMTVELSATCGTASRTGPILLCGILGPNDSGGSLALRRADGSAGIFGDGGDAVLSLFQTDGQTGLVLDGAGGLATFYQADHDIGVLIDGESGGAGLLTLRDADGSQRVLLDGSSTGTGGAISVHDDDGTETVEILGAEATTQGGQILLRNAAGTTTIELDGDFNGDGRIITQELQITGGSDLSEQFDIRPAQGEVKPGMVVSIDPQNPGNLVVSTRPYDRTVAGVISGAGGVKPGMTMGQKDTLADGAKPVALTGRVYAWCDASAGPIEPGDLLTSSATPGHAMRVTDHARSQGAILGKAMTSLKEGKGLVLVLVSLQ